MAKLSPSIESIRLTNLYIRLHLRGGVEVHHVQIEYGCCADAEQDDNGTPFTSPFDLPPHQNPGKSPRDHGNRHRIDDQRPEETSIPVRRLSVGGVQSHEKSAKRKSIFTFMTRHFHMPIFEHISDAGRFAVHRGQKGLTSSSRAV